jgi:hypothetical protein
VVAPAPYQWALGQALAPSVLEYLRNRAVLPGLFELSPADAALIDDCGGVRELMRANGQLGADVRLLVDDGERHLDAATELASALRCDVYLTPHGATVAYHCESGPVATWDAVAVDRASGAPVAWLVVRPADLASDVPTWFVSVAGRLRQSSGLVSVPLPGGLAFATRTGFAEAAAMAARLVDRHAPVVSGLTTIAVGAELGRFEIGRFNDAASLLGGVEFATLVAASLDVVQPDVQLAIAWPTSEPARIALDRELMRLADALNRTVWVPEQGGCAVVAPEDCPSSFVARDDQGAPGRWRPYRSRLSAAATLRFASGAAASLVPIAVEPDHGVPGLPAQVVRWPEEDQRADTPAYLVLPGSARPGFVALSRTRPELAAGRTVLEVKVRRRRMIDVPATVAAHSGSSAPAMPMGFAEFAGEDLVLPEADIARAVVTKVWWYGEDGQPQLGKLDRGTLADHLAGTR